MSKKADKFLVMDENADVIYGINTADGSIHVLQDVSDDISKQVWESEGRVLTAKEADAIAKESEFRVKQNNVVPRESETSYTIKIEDDGDVQIGCQYYEASEVARVVKLSRKFAAAKKAKR